MGRNILDIEEDYDIVLLTGERINSQSDTHFLFVHESGIPHPISISYFFALIHAVRNYTHVYITEEYNDLQTAKELIPLTSIAKYVQK